MNELIKITYNNDRPAVSARDLHDFLEVGARFNDWFPRMCEYGFTEGDDFNLLKIERVQNEGGRMVTRTVDDAVLTIDMAKELCMIQRNEKGKQARQYFLQIEKDWNSPEKVMARALGLSFGKALAASATPARAFQQQRGAVAAACFDLIALYLTTSIPRPCNTTAFDRVRQTHFWHPKRAETGKS